MLFIISLSNLLTRTEGDIVKEMGRNQSRTNDMRAFDDFVAVQVHIAHTEVSEIPVKAIRGIRRVRNDGRSRGGEMARQKKYVFVRTSRTDFV